MSRFDEETKIAVVDELYLTEKEANKSLLLVGTSENCEGCASGYDVRAIKVKDLLSSDDGAVLQLRQVGFESGSHLPMEDVGCGVLDSQIIIAGGVLHDNPPTQVYAFETRDLKQQQLCLKLKEMNANLKDGKISPFMMKVCGKLYALSSQPIIGGSSFEVFNPDLETWSALPEPNFSGCLKGCLVSGTKIFVSTYSGPVLCFDTANPSIDWRSVPGMFPGPLPYSGQALVMDFGNDRNVMFTYENYDSLCAYFMPRLCEDGEETATLVGRFRLPPWSSKFGRPGRCYLVHIGGEKACLVFTMFYRQGWDDPHRNFIMAIPFQYGADVSINEMLVEFMSPRIVEYPLTDPSPDSFPRTVGCFVL